MTPQEFKAVLAEIKRELIGVLNYVQLVLNVAENNEGSDIGFDDREGNP